MNNQNKVIWFNNNRSSNYSFSNPSRAKNLTRGFINYVKKCQSNRVKATRKEFLQSIGKHRPGQYTTFFSSIHSAGIIVKHGNGKNTHYKVGPNFKNYLDGKLIAI